MRCVFVVVHRTAIGKRTFSLGFVNMWPLCACICVDVYRSTIETKNESCDTYKMDGNIDFHRGHCLGNSIIR